MTAEETKNIPVVLMPLSLAQRLVDCAYIGLNELCKEKHFTKANAVNKAFLLGNTAGGLTWIRGIMKSKNVQDPDAEMISLSVPLVENVIRPCLAKYTEAKVRDYYLSEIDRLLEINRMANENNEGGDHVSD